MTLALVGPFKQLSHMCTWNFTGAFSGIRTADLCNAGAVLSTFPTELWSHTDAIRSIHVLPWKAWIHLSTALHKHFSQNDVSWMSKRPHNVEDDKLIKKNTTGTGQTMHFCSIFRVLNTTLPQVYLENLRVYRTMSVKEIIKFHQVHVENARFLFSLAAN